jgi:hypothetical protein
LTSKRNAKAVGEPVAALVRRRVLEEVIDADEARLRLLASGFGCVIFGLADIS